MKLNTDTVVNATLISAPISTKNHQGERDPKMHQTNKGNQWHFGMTANIGGDADSGYWGVEKREELQAQHPKVNWHIAMMPGKRKALDKSTPTGAILDKLEQAKVRIRAKLEHPFRVIKLQFSYTKVKYRGLAKNTANLMTLFALSNLWMARRRLLQGLQG